MLPMLRKLGRRLLEWAGLRPRDYRSRIRHGEVAMANEELAGLERAIRALPHAPDCVVEIGSYCGGSTVVLGRATARRNRNAKVYAIEPFTFHEPRYNMEYESLFDRNVADWQLGRVIVKMKTTSDKASAEWTQEIDFLYVDGDHSYEAVCNDIRNFVPKVREGGLFAFHDYKPVGKEGVRRAIDELVMPHYTPVFQIGSLICFRKRRAA